MLAPNLAEPESTSSGAIAEQTVDKALEVAPNIFWKDLFRLVGRRRIGAVQGGRHTVVLLELAGKMT